MITLNDFCHELFDFGDTPVVSRYELSKYLCVVRSMLQSCGSWSYKFGLVDDPVVLELFREMAKRFRCEDAVKQKHMNDCHHHKRDRSQAAIEESKRQLKHRRDRLYGVKLVELLGNPGKV